MVPELRLHEDYVRVRRYLRDIHVLSDPTLCYNATNFSYIYFYVIRFSNHTKLLSSIFYTHRVQGVIQRLDCQHWHVDVSALEHGKRLLQLLL